MQGDNRRRTRGDDAECHAESPSLGEHGHPGFHEEGLAHGKEVTLQYVEGVGHVPTEADRPEIESTATTRIAGCRVQRRKGRADSRPDEVAGRDQHLRDGDDETKKGQVAREEAQLVQFEWQEHRQYTGVGAEYRQTAEREIARERRPEARETEGQQPRRRSALELRELERLVRERKGQHRQRDYYYHASTQVSETSSLSERAFDPTRV